MAALRSTPEEQARKLKEEGSQNRYLSDPQKGLELLARLISRADNDRPTATKKLEELNRLLTDQFDELCKEDSLPNEAEMHDKLDEAIDELKDLINFPDLANKTVVGIGGSFSAGKSSFINSLLGKDLLPSGITPTTAIPTFLAQGEVEEINAINIFGNDVLIDEEAIKALCHDFHQKYKVQPTSFIKSVHIATPDFPYRHLAFVDTPGYSKSDTGDIAYNDRKVALDQLRLAEVLLWVSDISGKGTLSQTDIEFIREIRSSEEMTTSLPIFVVLNKADMVKETEGLQKVVEEVKSKLNHAGIPYSGIVGYDSVERRELCCDGESIEEYLGKASKLLKPCRIPVRFREVFETYSSYNLQQKALLEEQLRFFNEIKIRLHESLSPAEKKQIETYIDDLKKRMVPLQGLASQFAALGVKVEKLVCGILDEIRVDDEIPEMLELTADTRVRNKLVLAGLKSGQELSGTVQNILPAVGAFIECGLGDTLLLDANNVLSHFKLQNNNMWHMYGPVRIGTVCTVRILNINHGNGDIEVSVMLDAETASDDRMDRH